MAARITRPPNTTGRVVVKAWAGSGPGIYGPSMAAGEEEASFVAPEPAAALARLGMPMEDAMQTQRAVRRLHLQPVSHDVLLPLLELSLKAPTSSNTQD